MIATSSAPFYFQHLFATEEMQQLFSDRGRMTAWLDTEAALARAEAACGLIPESAASSITKAADFNNLDLDAMRVEYEQVGFPIVPLVHQLAKACDPESAKFVHWGATTQDIVDTGLVLQMRKGLDFIERDLDTMINSLAKLVSVTATPRWLAGLFSRRQFRLLLDIKLRFGSMNYFAIGNVYPV